MPLTKPSFTGYSLPLTFISVLPALLLDIIKPAGEFLKATVLGMVNPATLHFPEITCDPAAPAPTRLSGHLIVSGCLPVPFDYRLHRFVVQRSTPAIIRLSRRITKFMRRSDPNKNAEACRQRRMI
jgi:hypothetical protein